MIRLAISILLLLSSLLVIYKAPLHFLWLMAVVITNYPHVFILLTGIVFISAFWAAKFKLASLLISFAALVFYTVPVLSAYKQGSLLKKTISAAFPGETPTILPFNFFNMCLSLNIKDVTPQSLIYKIVNNNSLSLDYYPSASGRRSPVIVVIHGGSWENGNNKQFIPFNNYFANQGYNIAAINYRLAPAYQSPAPMQDTKDAIAYLKAHAEKLNIDTSNLVLLGRSAGAQIALVTAYASTIPGLKGVIDFYGPADMVWGGQVKTNKLMLNTDKIYTDYFGGVYSEMPQNFKANSACEYVNVSTPPTLIIHGEIDPMVSHIHSEHLNQKLTEAKIPHYFFSMTYATHGCDYSISSPGGQLTTYAVQRFIQSVTKQ